ncbi:alpha-mannosidase 2c1 [bacterium]|nr:alpha-mannosidase 2c1 [bacterium]
MDKKLEKLHIKRIERFQELVAKRVLTDRIDFDVKFAADPEDVGMTGCHALDYKPLTRGKSWGSNWEHFWLHLTGTIPEEWLNEVVVARIDIGGEGLVYSRNGYPIQGISNGSVFDQEFARDIVPLDGEMEVSDAIELFIEASANSLFGLFTEQDPEYDSDKRYGKYDATLNHAYMSRFDSEHWHLWLDLQTVLGLIRTLPENGVRRARMIYCTSEAIDRYADNPENAAICRQHFAEEFHKPAAPSDLNVVAVGHAHIDTAWLWPMAETIRKCGRTFASQCDLLNRYLDYIFGASQPQHYQFVKDHYPDIFGRVKEYVRQGRWEPQGGMWIEADCNIVSGESLVRQILYGKKFFRDEFDFDVDNLWLPDVFGYSAALPQILCKSGIKYFLTQKISWNQFNDFPHHTFMWKGIDGSEVLTHFPPENTYNSQLNTQYIVPGRDNFREKDRLDSFLSLFGVGDGGGGPKAENIETGLRMADLEGAPRVRFGTARKFFHDLEQEKDKLASWSGELYLELHRGTLTTQAKIKWHNRKLEQKLTAIEILASFLPLKCYPAGDLEKTWKTLLKNQFHDILPGSSITEVYRVANEELEVCQTACELMLDELAGELYEEETNSIVLANTLSTTFKGLVEFPDSIDPNTVLIDDESSEIPLQVDDGKTFGYFHLPPLSSVTYHKTKAHAQPTDDMSSLILENSLVRYEFGDNGQVLEATDLECNRNILPAGETGNCLTLYNDRPNDWDAWDVDLFYEKNVLETAKCISWKPLSKGDAFQGLHFEYRVGNSTIQQQVYLASESKELRFVTTVDWHEKHRMLRVAFPVDVKSDRAAFDIQYGFVYRPTHRNTSWDWARFESAGQRYSDLSDRDWGVALMNDSKYGYRLADGVLDLALLRSPTYPDPDADQGAHHFTYSLYPHSGDLVESDVFEQSAMLNRQPLVFLDKSAKSFNSPWQIDSDGISLEAVKKAEDDDAWVLRLVEKHGRQSTGKLTVKIPGCFLFEVDLMENEISDSLTNPLDLNFSAFEIRTYKVKV